MSKYSKINFIYFLQKWMDSVPGQTFLNYAYSWGAAVVILGTLFKLTHLPGANVMLFIGMGTEVVVFFISAFDRPFDKSTIDMQLDTHMNDEVIDYATEDPLGESVQGAVRTHRVAASGNAAPIAAASAETASYNTGSAGSANNGVASSAAVNNGAIGGGTIIGNIPSGPTVINAGGSSTGNASTGNAANSVAAGTTIIGGMPSGGTVIIGGGTSAPVSSSSHTATESSAAQNEKKEQESSINFNATSEIKEEKLTVNAASTATEGAATSASQATGNAPQMITPAPAVSAETAAEMEVVTKAYIERLAELNEMLEKVGQLTSRLSTDSEEMENLNRTLTGIARVYEMQLKSASQQITTQDSINEQTRIMAQKIQELNNIYTRMIEAMTVNMPGGAASINTQQQ